LQGARVVVSPEVAERGGDSDDGSTTVAAQQWQWQWQHRRRMQWQHEARVVGVAGTCREKSGRNLQREMAEQRARGRKGVQF